MPCRRRRRPVQRRGGGAAWRWRQLKLAAATTMVMTQRVIGGVLMCARDWPAETSAGKYVRHGYISALKRRAAALPLFLASINEKLL